MLRISDVPGTDFMCIYSCHPYSNPMGTVIIPIIQMRKLRLRWLKKLPRVTASQQQSKDAHADILAPGWCFREAPQNTDWQVPLVKSPSGPLLALRRRAADLPAVPVVLGLIPVHLISRSNVLTSSVSALPLPLPSASCSGPHPSTRTGHRAPMMAITPSNCSLAPKATFGYHRGCRSHSSASSVPGPPGQLRNGGN